MPCSATEPNFEVRAGGSTAANGAGGAGVRLNVRALKCKRPPSSDPRPISPPPSRSASPKAGPWHAQRLRPNKNVWQAAPDRGTSGCAPAPSTSSEPHRITPLQLLPRISRPSTTTCLWPPRSTRSTSATSLGRVGGGVAQEALHVEATTRGRAPHQGHHNGSPVRARVCAADRSEFRPPKARSRERPPKAPIGESGIGRADPWPASAGRLLHIRISRRSHRSSGSEPRAPVLLRREPGCEPAAGFWRTSWSAHPARTRPKPHGVQAEAAGVLARDLHQLLHEAPVVVPLRLAEPGPLLLRGLLLAGAADGLIAVAGLRGRTRRGRARARIAIGGRDLRRQHRLWLTPPPATQPSPKTKSARALPTSLVVSSLVAPLEEANSAEDPRERGGLEVRRGVAQHPPGIGLPLGQTPALPAACPELPGPSATSASKFGSASETGADGGGVRPSPIFEGHTAAKL